MSLTCHTDDWMVEYRARAIAMRTNLKLEFADAPYTKEEFAELYPWMLW
jgi:hypothetical protein